MADHLPAPVVVLGLGKMGAAMARRLRDLGHPLIVWNRSFHKAGALAAEKTDGAKVMAARTAEEALLMGREEDGSGPLILSVLSDTDTTVALLTDPVVLPLLTGRVVVNLASGSPDDGRMVAAKLDGKGLLAYVDGAFSGPPQKARGGAGVVFASCENAAVFKSHCGLLAGLGKVVFTGRIGSSRALDYAVVDLALVNLMALASNTAMLEREGVNTDQLFASLEHRFATMPAYLRGNYEKMDQVSPLPKGDRDGIPQ